MNDAPLLSIIIPAYNAEYYVIRAIQSLLDQPYRPIEIIVIDDGSTDYTYEVANKYAQEHSFIKALKKQNGGAGSARNAGLDICTGDYITFLDSDDIIEPSTYTEAIKLCKTSKAQIVQFPVQYSSKNGTVTHAPKLNDITSKTALYSLFMKETISSSVWDKVYTREAIINNRFKEALLYEDMFFMANIIQQTTHVAFSSKGRYVYSYRPDSTVNSKANYKRTKDYLFVRMKVYEFSYKYPKLWLQRTRHLINTFKHSEVAAISHFTDDEQASLFSIIDSHKPSLLSIVVNLLTFKIGISRFRMLMLLFKQGSAAVFGKFCNISHTNCNMELVNT